MKAERLDPGEVTVALTATPYEFHAVANALRASARRSREAGYEERAAIVESTARLIFESVPKP